MLNMNRATLLGHAGRDPEIRDLNNGGRAAVFTPRHHREVDGCGRPARRGDGVAPGRGLRPGRERGRRRCSARATGSWSREGSRRVRSATARALSARSPRSSSRGGRTRSTSSRRGGRGMPLRPMPIPARRPGRAKARGRHEPPLRPPGRPRAGGPAVVRRGVGAVLHRAVREPDLGRLLGVHLPDLDRPHHDRQRDGRARHAEPGIADLPVRLADTPHRASRSGCGSRRG